MLMLRSRRRTKRNGSSDGKYERGEKKNYTGTAENDSGNNDGKEPPRVFQGKGYDKNEGTVIFGGRAAGGSGRQCSGGMRGDLDSNNLTRGVLQSRQTGQSALYVWRQADFQDLRQTCRPDVPDHKNQDCRR